MTQPLTSCVLLAMHPLVASAAHGGEIIAVQSAFGRRLPCLDVVEVECAATVGRNATTKACATVTRDHIPPHTLPRAGRVDALALRADSAFPPRMSLAPDSVHAVPIALEPWAWTRGCLGHELPALCGVLSPRPMRLVTRLRPGVVLAAKVVPARSRRDAEVLQFGVDSLGVAIHKRRDLVSRESFLLVLLTEPYRVKVRGFACHATYHNPKKGGTP